MTTDKPSIKGTPLQTLRSFSTETLLLLLSTSETKIHIYKCTPTIDFINEHRSPEIRTLEVSYYSQAERAV